MSITQTRVFNSPSAVYSTVRRINADYKRCIHERDHYKKGNDRDYKRDIQNSNSAKSGYNRLVELANYIKARQNSRYA